MMRVFTVKAWKCARWDVQAQPRLQVWMVDPAPRGRRVGAGQQENFRFNAGSTLFRNRVLSAISMVRSNNQTLSLNCKNYGVLGCKLIHK